jgi:RNA polymerase sigma-70 factor (ECF subfamily)
MDYEQTLRRWLSEHRGILIRLSRAYAAPCEEEDLMQDIVLALWRSLPGFRGAAKPSTWIFQVALNVALSSRRAASRRPTLDQVDDLPEQPVGGEDDAMSKLALSAVWRALKTMAPIDRAVLLMALEGSSQQDIADVLGVSVSNAGVKLHRARRRLQDLMSPPDAGADKD